MTFQHDPIHCHGRNTLLRWFTSVLYQLLAGLEGSGRRRVQMLAARTSRREHKMRLKMKETQESLARDREERLANEDRIEDRESALSKETEHA